MVTEFLQNSRKYRVRPKGNASVTSDTANDRGKQQTGIQDEQRFLEPGQRAASDDGSEPEQLKPEFTGARKCEFHSCSFAFSAQYLVSESKPRYGAEPDGDATAEPEPTAAASTVKHAKLSPTDTTEPSECSADDTE